MTDDRAIYVLFGLMMLVLPLSALIARRPAAGSVLRALAGWAVIVVLLYVAFSQRGAIAEFAGTFGERLGLAEQSLDGETVRIRQSVDGHFWAIAKLNGVERRMLVDSGATSTAISEATANAIGVTPRRVPPVVLATANGTIEAARGRIETVRIGTLETRDLPVVISSTFGELDVVGMNFLSRLGSWRVERGTLILEPAKQP